MSFLKRLFGGGSGVSPEVKKLQKTVDQIVALEDDYHRMPDKELQGKTELFRERLRQGETLDDLLVEAFATVR